MPEDSFIMRMKAHLMSVEGFSKYHRIYLDNQSENKKAYKRTVEYLALFFSTSKTSVKYRLDRLDLIEEA